MINEAQTFWLENLQQADRYNAWIFEQIKHYLGNFVLAQLTINPDFYPQPGRML